jgi:type IV secretion system protein VirB3
MMRDPLFTIMTRPAMKWGVTLEGIVIAGFFSAIGMIATNNPFFLLLYIPLHIVMYGLCLKDPRIFRLLFVWTQTKAKSLGWRYWGIATATPLINTKHKKYKKRLFL